MKASHSEQQKNKDNTISLVSDIHHHKRFCQPHACHYGGVAERRLSKLNRLDIGII